MIREHKALIIYGLSLVTSSYGLLFNPFFSLVGLALGFSGLAYSLEIATTDCIEPTEELIDIESVNIKSIRIEATKKLPNGLEGPLMTFAYESRKAQATPKEQLEELLSSPSFAANKV